MRSPTPSPLDWVLLVLLGAVWGGSFLAIKIALTGFAPLSIAALRIILAATLLTALAKLVGVGLPDRSSARGRRTWLHCIGMGVFSNALPFSLLAWGQMHVTSGYAGITMASMPLLVLPLAHAFIPGEAMTGRKTLGFVIGFAGAALLIGPGAVIGDPADDAILLARLACIGAAVSYAIGSIVTRRAPAGPQFSFAAGALLVAAAIITPAAVWVEGWPGAAPAAAWASVIYLGAIPTALATLVLVRLVRSAGPSFLSLVNYQVPVWAVLFGLVALGEQLPTQFICALALILAGLAVSQRRSAGRS